MKESKVSDVILIHSGEGRGVYYDNLEKGR
jgi:hypothetical protein